VHVDRTNVLALLILSNELTDFHEIGGKVRPLEITPIPEVLIPIFNISI
jgi:hypothetical protein